MPVFEVREAIDLFVARHAAREMGAQLGFRQGDCQELAIVVSELTSNILKYGVRGSITIEKTSSVAHGLGIMILAHDQGPPFHDLGLAVRDGYDDRGPIDPATLLKRGGLGTGLGAVIRLTDSFGVEPLSPGKIIRVVRYRSRPKARR